MGNLNENIVKTDLQNIFKNVNDWLKFAEAKNLGLLTLNAAIFFGFLQIKFADDSIVRVAGIYIFSIFLLFSFLSALLSLFPIVSKIENGDYAKSWINKLCNIIDKEVKFENIHYYGYLKDIDESTFEEKYLKKTNQKIKFNQFEKELATQILYNSRITWLKYQLFKIGAYLTLAGIVLSIIALPILQLIISLIK